MNYARKSAEAKQREGSYRADRDEPEGVAPAAVSSFTPPSHLDTLAKNYWRKNIKTLDLSGILKESDLTTFALCCAAYSDYVFWSTICRDAKKAIEDLRENPPEDIEAQISAQALTQANLEKAQKQKNSQMKTFLDFAKSLGLTAVDRGKIRGEGKKEADAFSGFLS